MKVKCCQYRKLW